MILKPLQVLFLGSVVALIPQHHDSFPKSRSFYMGFSASPHELTPVAKDEALQFAKTRGDVLAEDFVEGLPWTELKFGKRFHETVEAGFARRKKRLKGTNLYVSVSPLNHERAAFVGHLLSGEEPRWVPDDFNDPDAIQAYTRFALGLIGQFRPRYFAYALDVNILASKKPHEWKSFLEFASTTYKSIKLVHRELPVFVTIHAGTFWTNPAKQRDLISQILPYTDYIAVSAYPYTSGYNHPETIPRDFFSRIAALNKQKPFAIAETGFPAEWLRIDNAKIPSREAWQHRYLDFVLEQSHRLNAEFIIWFHSRDFESVAQQIDSSRFSQAVINTFSSRKSNGLIDDKGDFRSAYHLWQRWAKLPVEDEDYRDDR